MIHGDLGTSFGLYPAEVNGLIAEAVPWSVALQLPAILVGWILGNVLGAIAAYKGGWFDRGGFIGSLLLSSMPYYAFAILLLYLVAVRWDVLPAAGGYSFGVEPSFTWASISDAAAHYWLPFLSLVLVFIGGQAIGIRSMAIYELGSDYVEFSKGLGIGDARIVRYIFRNAMLPQITGLALSIGHLVGGALITEVVFSCPGIGPALPRDPAERLPGDPGGHVVDHGSGAARELHHGYRLRLYRSPHPCGPDRELGGDDEYPACHRPRRPR